MKTNIQYPTGNVQFPSVEALRAADFLKIKLAGCLTWTLDIDY
jgi:hypothetical protein